MSLEILKMPFVILLSFFILIPQSSEAEIDTEIQVKIKDECINVGHSRKPIMKELELVCACVARSHFDSALKEPLESQGASDLVWVLKYYEKRDSKEASDFSKTNLILFEYDLDVVQSCLEEVRGK